MSLKKQTISGVKWTTLSTIVLAVVGIVKLSVLARYLDAGDFGLMALVTFVLGFMNLFMDMGLTSAILHKQDITKNEYASLYWINVCFSIVLFFLIGSLSNLVASFYEEPELIILLPLMAISIILSALGRQFKTIEQKHLNFKYITLVDIFTAIGGMVVGVLLAVKGYGVYALVYAALTQYTLSNGVYFLNGIRKRGLLFHFKFLETKPFLKIGAYQVGGQIINYFNRDFDVLIIGKLLGTEVLGGYSLAKQLVSRPMSMINPVITKVAGPVLSLLQKDLDIVKSKYLFFLKIISTINFSAYLLLAIFAKQLVYLFYGENFVEITFIVQILSVYMYLRSIGSPLGSLVIATGRTDVEFYWNLLLLLIVPLVVFVGANFYTIEIVTICLVIMMLLLTFLAWKLVLTKLIKVGFKEYFSALFPNYIFLIKVLRDRG